MSDSKWEKTAKENAKKIKFAIDNLSEHKGLSAELLSGGWDYDSFWNDVEKINEMFKELDLKNEDRDRLWGLLGKECDEVKGRMEKEKRKRERQSKQRKAMVLHTLNKKIHYKIEAADNILDWKEAKSALFDLQDWMKSGWEADHIHNQLLMDLIGNEGHFSNEDWEECWEVWKEKREKLDYKYKAICNSNRRSFRKNWIKPIANEATTGDPYKAHELIKKAQNELHSGKAFSDTYFEKFTKDLQKYWDRASKKIDEKEREKHNKWLSDMRGHISRWKNNIEKQNNFINKKQNEIDDLRSELKDAKTSDYENKVRSWIEEKQIKIKEASRNIEEFESKIEDVQKKIDNS